MTTIEDLNQTILIKYITKHYKIYKIHPIWPISKKLSSNISFKVFDIAEEVEKNMYFLDRQLCKILGVDPIEVSMAFKTILFEEIARLRRLQTTINEQDNF